MTRFPIALGTATLATVVLVPSVRSQPAEDLRRVADYLLGTMESTIPARDGQDEVVQVRMTTCAMALTGVEATAEPSLHLYQEQAMVTALERPYRQRLLKLSVTADGEAVESFGFRLQEDAAWAGLCDRPLRDRVIAVADLGEATCGLRLEPRDDGYWGTTPDGGCPSNYRGASYTTNTIYLTDTTTETWDRGFDADGNQVWGADDEGDEFVDVMPEN